MKNYRRNNYIGKMKKGFKQKLSLLMIACLLFTGYRGLTISGRADSSHTEQNNEIEVSGSQVKVQLLGADLRRAATEAILKGEKVGKSNLRSYSKDQELATEFEEYFDGEKEIYNIPLNSIAENLEESLNAEEADLQIYVERDAKNLDRLVRKESKESLLLYSKESAVAGLLPKKEEATTVSLTEEKASDSNLERNTELTGSELITFVYENKSTERMTFQLSVDGNKYPKVTVASKTSLFKQFLGDAKKAQAEAKNAKATEAKAESTEAQTVEASKVEESSAEAKQEVAESKATEASKATEESKASEETRKDDSEVAIVSTAAEAVAESTEAKAEVKAEASEEATEAKVEATETEVKETAAKAETAQAEKATEAQKAVVEDSSLLKDITEHSEEILPELQSIRFTQYSLNELGRKSQNVEIEGFGNVQVFYDEAAFDGDVVLEAKRLFKPEEEVEGEKLSEEQVKVLKEHSIYDDAASLDIRFVDKKDSAVEVEPKSPVSVRISIDKKALPAEVSADAISIHHLVENNETKEVERVETVVQPARLSRLELGGLTNDEIIEKQLEDLDKNYQTNATSTLTKNDSVDTEQNKEVITKEFTVNSFSLYQITFEDVGACLPIRFHYVDKNFNEISPTVRVNEKYRSGIEYSNNGWSLDFTKPKHNYYNRDVAKVNPKSKAAGDAMKDITNYKFIEVYPYSEHKDNMDVLAKGYKNEYFDFAWKYGDNGDFGDGVDFIDDTGFTTVYAKKHNRGVTRWIWVDKNKDNGPGKPKGGYVTCDTRDFYFVYDIDNQNAFKRVEKNVNTKNEKYITNNLDGTYDLTLTSKTEHLKEKEKLDIVFLIDTSKNMNLSFDSLGNSRKAKVQEYATQMVTNLLNNTNYDLQFGIVGFGGGNTVNGSTVTDKPFDDVTYIGGYTNSASKFKSMIENMPESTGKVTGPNYTAAILGMRYLIDGSFSGDLPNTKIENLNKRRDTIKDNARRIVIMLTDNDPVYSFITQDGVYDETEKLTNDSIRKFEPQLKKGDSYGNGVDFSRVGLNQARGYLSKADQYAAFYSIGIGDESNWRHLKELTEAHAHDQSDKWKAFGDKYIRAKSALAIGADSKVFNGSTPEKLKQSFEELEQIIAPEQVSNIKIKDTFSENVDLVANTELVAEIYKLKENNVETDGNALIPAEYNKLGLNKLVTEKHWNSVKNRQEISLKTDPENFELPAGYEIRLTAKIKPSEIAYKKLRKGLAETDQGMKRTDLNDIYRTYLNGRIYGDANKYGASTDIQGLFTNDEAKFNYSWRGQPQEKPYNKPIVKVQSRDFKIEKQIVGLDGNAYITSDNKSKNNGNNAASGFTKLGIEILKNIKFTVYEIQDDGTPKEYVSFKLYQDGNNEDQSKEGIIKVGDITVKRHQVQYIKEYDRLSLGYTITGLDPSKKYKVKETVSGKSYQYINVSENFANLKYEFKESSNDSNEEAFKLTDGKVVTIKNTYEKENPKKKVTIEKKVKNIYTGKFLKKEEDKTTFDFYLRLYHPSYKVGRETVNGDPLSETEMKAVLKSFPSNISGKIIDIIEIPPNQTTSPKKYAFHFQLHADEKLVFELDENLEYDYAEKVLPGYLEPGISVDQIGSTVGRACTVIVENHDNTHWYTCFRFSAKTDYYVTFVNKANKIAPATGIVRDITPYLFGIFGFVAMAGAYLTINKKRREA